MHTRTPVATTVAVALYGGALALVSPLSLQSAIAAEGEEPERIQVTGSRITRTDLETAVPITTISKDDILATGAINVADVLNKSPVSFVGQDQSTSAFTTGSVGLNTTQLRGLDEERTLVLVNGRRFVSGVSPSVGYAVDLNAIPTSMIERIDILKSASSAVYGSDAVAGVINIITRTDFEGVELHAQTGIASEGDRETHTVSFTTGGNFANGNGWISVGYDEDNGLKSTDRDFAERDTAVLLDDNGNEFFGNVFSSFPPQARVGAFNGDGTPFVNSSEEGGSRFNRAQFRQLVTPLERRYAAAGLTQEINDEVSFFTEVNWNSSKTRGSTIEPFALDVNSDIWSRDRGGTGGMDVNSPLLPDLLRTNLMGAGVANLNEVSFVRRLVEFGPRSTDVERATIRVAAGVDWSIDDNWISNTYITWGQTDQFQDNGGQLNVERAFLALDVERGPDGQLRCVNATARLAGCVPLNLFGAGTISDEAVRYARSPAKAKGQVEQLVLATTIAGELPMELEGGMVGLAAGFEYRKEEGSFEPADLAQVGASSTNQADATDGEFQTRDVFVETRLPFMDNFSVDIAARYSDHSITGSDTTWNLGLEFKPFDGLLLRASAATAIRTPNIADLFGGRGETFATITDPCSGVTAADTSQAAVNCRSIAPINARIQRDGEFILTQMEAQGTGGTIGGNPKVKEEEADSWSAGIVWQITDEVSTTIDYYDYEIDDAIDTISRTTVLNRCYEVAPSEFDPTCGGNTLRDANGALLDVNSGTSNENVIETQGVDVELNYNTEVDGYGSFGVNLIWNHTFEFVETAIIGDDSVDFVGQVDSPDNRINLNLSWSMDNLSVAWRMRYWDSSVDSVNEENFNFTNFQPLNEKNNIGSVTYTDVSASYIFSEGIDATFGIRNLFDREPPLLPQGTNLGGTGINTASEAYDVTGRYFYTGIKVKF